MKKSEKNKCSYHGHTYENGAEVCGDGKCMICKDGRWEETSSLFPPKDIGL